MDDLDFGVAVLGSVGIILVNENKGRRRRQWVVGRQVQWSIINSFLFGIPNSVYSCMYKLPHKSTNSFSWSV